MKHDAAHERGSLILLTLIFMIVLGMLVATFIFNIVHVGRITASEIDNARALYIAEAGIDKAVYYLVNTAPDHTSNGSWRTVAYPLLVGNPPSVAEAFANGAYRIWVETVDGGIYITSEGVYGDLDRSRIVRARFYEQALDQWKTNMRRLTDSYPSF